MSRSWKGEVGEVLIFTTREKLPWWRRISLRHPILVLRRGRVVHMPTETETEQVKAYIDGKYFPVPDPKETR